MKTNPVFNSWLKETQEGQEVGKVIFLDEFEPQNHKNALSIMQRIFEAGQKYEKEKCVCSNLMGISANPHRRAE